MKITAYYVTSICSQNNYGQDIKEIKRLRLYRVHNRGSCQRCTKRDEWKGKALNMNVIEKEGETLDSDVIGCFSIAQIINGWMIVVDVAKTKPFRHNRRETSFEL